MSELTQRALRDDILSYEPVKADPWRRRTQQHALGPNQLEWLRQKSAAFSTAERMAERAKMVV